MAEPKPAVSVFLLLLAAVVVYLASPHPLLSAPASSAQGHYLWHGWRAGAQPNRWFSPSEYRRRSPDVAATEIEPLEHYLRYGTREGRDPRYDPACFASPSTGER